MKWSILDINNVPCDLFKGVYEFETRINNGDWVKWYLDPCDIVVALTDDPTPKDRFRYRLLND